MKYSLLFFVCASLCAQLQAEKILLDTVMTKEEQRKTGVNTLSFQQKVALEDWLNDHCLLKMPSPAPSPSLSMSINIDNGKQIQLSDNSIWEISPADLAKSAAWITPFPVKLSPSGDPSYPVLITNILSTESIKARRVMPTQP